MQSNTSSNTTFLERLAVARLQHTVNELQTQVDQDRTLVAPTRKALYCVCDDTALTANIPELKRFVADKSITMIVPFATLDSLDRLKKGTENANIHARESIRFFDRAQTAAGRKQITGVRIQGPTEKFSSWEECLAACAGSAAATDPELQQPPNHIKELLNSAVYHVNRFVVKGAAGDQQQQKVLLVTNDEILRDWAELYGVPTARSGEIAGLVKREEMEYMEKRRHYDFAMNNPRSPASPGGGRGGRGGGMGSSRGGRGGGGFARRDSWKDEEPRSPISPNGFGGGGGRGRSPRDSNPPDFVLRGPPRGVARGRGKLWEP
ncbi:hypothetical protein BZA05DRAFT_1155 [Tricharina praecox]|uniref:uncharacterized protein n=1 Tax=Tricharina praecox TaxID=43433 RepID=UPI00221F2F03|nr:uncharacterized protein BZA05DRAFT_1155 [Tricharina praecox]KAI5858364.1 hypothetical protein BZA05DRAFT_1155 [Tricharina praecox]